MENLSAYRYCIAMKKGRKIFNIIVGCIMLLISSIFIILTVIFYVLEQEFGFYTFLGILLIPWNLKIEFITKTRQHHVPV